MSNRLRPSSHRFSRNRDIALWRELRRLRQGIVPVRHRSLRAGAQGREIPRAGAMIVTRRISRVTLPLIILALLMIIGPRYVMQRLNVEAIIRQRVIPQLEKQYGTTIEVGPVESDWLNRIILRDVVIGRDPRSPLGALAQVKSITLNVDLISLALGRVQPAQAIHSVLLDSPQLYLLRDAQGQVNILKILRRQPPKAGARWTGLATVRNGRLWYEDYAVRSASGRILLADVRTVDGAARFNGNDPISYAGSAALALVGPDRAPVKNLVSQGEVAADGKSLALAISFPSAPAALATDYAFRTGQVVAREGDVGGTLVVAWDAAAPRHAQWRTAGDLTLRAVSGYARTLKEPNTARPLSIAQVTGTVAYNQRNLDMGAFKLGTARNAVPLQGASDAVTFRVAVQRGFVGSQRTFVQNVRALGASDTAGRWVALGANFPPLPATALAYYLPKRDFVLRNGSIGGNVQVSYNASAAPAQRWWYAGNLALQSVTGYARALKEPNTARPLVIERATGPLTLVNGAFETPGLSAVALNTPLRIAGTMAILSAATPGKTSGPVFDLRLRSHSADTARLVRLGLGGATTRDATLRGLALSGGRAQFALHVTGTVPAARVEGSVTIPNFRARHPRYGFARAQRLQADLQGARSDGAGQLRANIIAPGFRAENPQAGQWYAGNLRGGIQWAGGFGDSRRPTLFEAKLNAGSVSTAMPQRGQWQAANVRATIQWLGNRTAGGLRAYTSARNLVALLPGWGRWQAGDVRATIHSRGSSLTGGLRAQVEALKLATSVPKYGRWSAGAMQGTIHWAGGTRAPSGGDVSLVNFSGRVPRYGNMKGKGVRVIAFTPNLARPRWSGTARLDQLDASAFNLAAVAPAVAREVKGLGTVSGRVRFAGLAPGAEPTVRGSVALSRATVRDITLRDVTAEVSLAKGRLRLADVNGQSDVGQVSGDIDTDLRGKNTRFALVTPNLALDASRLAPYLPPGLTVSGTATGRLRVASTTEASDMWEVSYDLAVPDTTVRTKDEAGQNRGTVRALAARLTGRGTMRYQDRDTWQVVGDVGVNAGQVSVSQSGPQPKGLAIPQWLSGSRAEKLKLTARGSVARTATGVEPRFAGTVDVERSALPLPAPAANTTATTVSTDTNEPRDAAARWMVVSEAQAAFVVKPGVIQVPRLSLRAGSGAVTGHFILPEDGTINGQVLAQRVAASEMQQWLLGSPPATQDLDVAGVMFARVNLSGDAQAPRADVQTRLYHGTVRVKEATMPIDAARAEFTLQLPDWRLVPVREFTAWSNGGRIRASGRVARAEKTFNLDLDATVTDLRIADIALTPALQNLRRDGEVAGLLSGQVSIDGSLDQPIVQGRAALRLAHAFGFNLEEVVGLVRYRGTPDGPIISMETLEEWEGRSEEAPVVGAFAADYPRGVWSAKFKTTAFSTGRLLHAADNASRTPAPPDPLPVAPLPVAPNKKPKPRLRDLPLRGSLRADVDVSGVIRQDGEGAAFEPDKGTVRVAGDALRWRGLPLGVLTADLAVRKGALQVSTLEVRRPVNPPVAIEVATDQAEPTLIRVAGALPTALDTPGLDAQVTVDNAQLVFLVDVLEEVRETLREQGRSVTALDRVLKPVAKLRSGLEGHIELAANLTGSWNNPVVAVSRLTVRDAVMPGPYGEPHKLPSVSAAFTYNQNGKGVISVEGTEVRLAATKDNIEDTVVRVLLGGSIVPDGPVNLDVEVLNANLAQLAQWVPSLREQDGQAILRGALTQVTFQVGGTTADPTVTGSILAEDLEYQNYNLDRLRIARFDIANGQLAITPGNLTIVQGAFQSSVAWGRLPWSWDVPGPRQDAPLEIHLPIQRADFGALAGTFLPALTNADADEFSGSVDVTGTLQAPRLSGQVTIGNGRFRVDPAYMGVETGIQGLAGTVRFINGNRLEIDAANPLKGRLISARDVKAPPTGNAPATERAPEAALVALKAPKAKPPELSGAFTLGGDVTLDLDPAYLSDLGGAVDKHRYNLQLEVANGAYFTEDISGLQNVNLGLIWRTGPGQPARSQNLRWMLSASSGTLRRGKKTPQVAGNLYSFAAATLAPNFANSLDALAHSRMRDFDNFADFTNMAVYSRFTTPDALKALGNLQNLEDKRSRITLAALQFGVRDVASGILDGTLFADNQRATPQLRPTPPKAAPRTTIAARVAALRGASFNGNASQAAALVTPLAAPAPVIPAPVIPAPAMPAPATPAPGAAPESESFNIPPVRLEGEITLVQAQISGAPAGGEGGALVLPGAPVLDIRLLLGRNVEFALPTVRTNLDGELEVSGTPRSAVLTGTVSTRGGVLRFPRAQARINEGEFVIAASRDPGSGMIRTSVNMDATASGRVGRYQITLKVQGPLDLGTENPQNLRIDVTSNPPLSRDEAFQQLFGTAGLGSGDTNEKYKGAIIGLISAPLFGSLEQSLGKAFGLDSLSLEYRLNEPLAVEIGKSLGSRVYVVYRRTVSGGSGSKPGELAPNSLRIEYRIKGDLQLVYQSEKTGFQVGEQARHRVTLEKRWRF